ncbi:MAG: molybdopterin-dependent oxidoreductase [Firmicutes bacterium]|nr:molybdopterin-dependent oxidoreductase [Bacillota bacterium]
MKVRMIALVALLAMSLILTTGCGTDNIDISGYADSEIAIEGIAKDDVIVTITDLKEMDCITVKTESTSDKIGEVRATGPTLETVLAAHGVDIGDVKKITFHGKDDYTYSLKGDYLAEHDVILAFGIDGEPLNEEDAPCRIIIPQSDSAYWIRLLDHIKIELK